MFRKISEMLSFVEAVTPQDITQGVTSAYHSMAGIGRVLAVASTATIAKGKKLTLQLMQAKDATGDSAKALGDAVDVAITADEGGAAFGKVEARDFDLDVNNGFAYVAVTISSDNAVAVDGAAILVFGDRTFNP